MDVTGVIDQESLLPNYTGSPFRSIYANVSDCFSVTLKLLAEYHHFGQKLSSSSQSVQIKNNASQIHKHNLRIQMDCCRTLLTVVKTRFLSPTI